MLTRLKICQLYPNIIFPNSIILQILSRSSKLNTSELLTYKYSTILNHTNYYNYHIHRKLNETDLGYSYQWRRTAWSICTDECNGSKFRSSVCYKNTTDEIVDDSYCVGSKPPDEHQTCSGLCEST